MKKVIEIGDKKCCFFKDITPEEQTEINSMLTRWSTSVPDLKEKVMENLNHDNRGATVGTSKHIVVVLGPQTSKAELLNTLAHEIRHVVDIICADSNHIPAELTGEIFSHFADWV